ncbi:MAG: hypothetical protein OEV44_03445 [Spirochaetota bacterium]|nr:hypothetical protein [Spirochaetota bacterium]
MGEIKKLIPSFKQEMGSSVNQFADNILEKILYDDGWIESDLRALIKRSADLRRQGASCHSLIKSKSEYNRKMQDIISQLSDLNKFLEFITKKLPDRKSEIIITINENSSYLKVHLVH